MKYTKQPFAKDVTFGCQLNQRNSSKLTLYSFLFPYEINVSGKSFGLTAPPVSVMEISPGLQELLALLCHETATLPEKISFPIQLHCWNQGSVCGPLLIFTLMSQ